MLLDPGPSRYDLRFRLLGIPVRIHPFFWLFSLVMGANAGGPDRIAIWVGCVFVSILVHELGHAALARRFGWPPEIILFSLGGLATFRPDARRTTAKMVAISLAGPGAGFVFYLVLWAIWLLTGSGERGSALEFAFRQLFFINLYWGLLNLLPVFPLDGGQVVRELLISRSRQSGEALSAKISMAVGAAVAIYFFLNGQLYVALLFGLLAWQSAQMLQAPPSR